MSNFVKLAIENAGGKIKPLLIGTSDLSGPSLMNPSVFVDSNGRILVNIRNVNYTLYHVEKNRFEHVWGPLVYIHPESDLKLRTTNYIAELNADLDVIRYTKVNTSAFDTYEPKWEFVGLEDCRLFQWDGKTYLCGVRRDTTTNGQGRMELSQIVINFEQSSFSAREVSRLRIPCPPPDNEYCVKNCTPVEDRPFHLLKWTNPTCLMKFDPNGKENTVTFETNQFVPMELDMRGGSQVIRFKDGYLTLVHETSLYKSEQGNKDGTYRHRFVYWTDREFKERKFSKSFSFLNMKIEFCCGMVKYGDDFLISFGAQDNAAYILQVPQSFVYDFIMNSNEDDDADNDDE
jgi:hypothetical protein